MQPVRFGVFEVDPARRELRREGLRIHIAEKPFELLLLLLEKQGQIVTRDEMKARLWPGDVFVEFDNNLYVILNRVRQALGDSNTNPRYIGTVPRRGYRFLAAIEPVQTEPAPAEPANSPPRVDPVTYEAQPRFPGLRIALSAGAAVILTFLLAGSPLSPIREGGTVNADAHEDYLQARYFWNQRSPEGVKKSLEYFQRAALKEPRYAAAHLGLAESHAILAASGLAERARAYQDSWEESERALALDPRLAGAYAVRGFVAWQLHRDAARAEREYRRGLDLDPGHATTRQWYALFLSAMGRQGDAMREVERARTLAPFSMIVRVAEGQILSAARQHDRAIQAMRRALEMEPEMLAPQVFLFRAYVEKHLAGPALSPEEFQDMFRRIPKEDAFHDFWHAYLVGNDSEALRFLNEAAATVGELGGPCYEYAGNYALLGQKENALRWLARSFEELEFNSNRVTTDPRFQSLRDDPRFVDLLRQAGFPVQ